MKSDHKLTALAQAQVAMTEYITTSVLSIFKGRGPSSFIVNFAIWLKHTRVQIQFDLESFYDETVGGARGFYVQTAGNSDSNVIPSQI